MAGPPQHVLSSLIMMMTEIFTFRPVHDDSEIPGQMGFLIQAHCVIRASHLTPRSISSRMCRSSFSSEHPAGVPGGAVGPAENPCTQSMSWKFAQSSMIIQQLIANDVMERRGAKSASGHSPTPAT